MKEKDYLYLIDPESGVEYFDEAEGCYIEKRIFYIVDKNKTTYTPSMDYRYTIDTTPVATIIFYLKSIFVDNKIEHKREIVVDETPINLVKFDNNGDTWGYSLGRVSEDNIINYAKEKLNSIIEIHKTDAAYLLDYAKMFYDAHPTVLKIGALYKHYCSNKIAKILHFATKSFLGVPDDVIVFEEINSKDIYVMDKEDFSRTHYYNNEFINEFTLIDDGANKND